jgi:hypothetical protein
MDYKNFGQPPFKFSNQIVKVSLFWDKFFQNSQREKKK